MNGPPRVTGRGAAVVTDPDRPTVWESGHAYKGPLTAAISAFVRFSDSAT